MMPIMKIYLAQLQLQLQHHNNHHGAFAPLLMHKAGLTLIELMMVIAILAILAGMAIRVILLTIFTS